jgi:predicted aspartyl protease
LQITAAIIRQFFQCRFQVGWSTSLLVLTLSWTSAQAQAAKASVEVPFEFVHNQIVVDVKINGKGPFKMLLDTDTDPSAIDLEAARELGLDVGQKEYQTTGGGTDANVSHLTTLNLVEVGNTSAQKVVAAALDLSKLAKQMDGPVRGVLGYSFLKDRIVQIDYANTKVRFFSASPYPRIDLTPNTVNVIALPFRREEGEVIVDSVFINNEKMRATLDTGSSHAFSLTPEAIAVLGLDEQVAAASADKSVGYNGEYESRSGVLKSVRLGRYSAESVPAQFWLPNTGHDKKRFQVNIGNAFFQDFLMTFDFKARIVVFERVD